MGFFQVFYFRVTLFHQNFTYMQRTSTASLDFISLPIEKKPSFGNGVTLGLTTYADDFPNLPIAVADLQKTNSALSEGITAANTGNRLPPARI